jgi:ribonuclease BN (tRNA processing enzyme)
MDALTFLGTGCGWPMAKRCSSAILLDAAGNRLLLDAGEPCAHRLKALSVPFASVDAVLISHGHSDHISGLMMFIQGAWLESRTRPLPIYLPGELIQPLRAWMEAVYLPEKLIGFPLAYRAWEDQPKPACIAGARVSTNPTTHLDGLRTIIDPAAADRFLPYSLALDWPDADAADKRLVYSADLGRPQDMDALFERPCDLLICELAHFTPEALFLYLKDKPIRRLCLTHLSIEFDARAEEIVALGRKMLPGLETIQTVSDCERVEF